MLHSVMVPLDGSRFAEYALPVAIRLARAAGARLRLLMVHEPMMALVPAADVPIGIGIDELGLRAEAQTYLAETAHELGTIGPGPVTFEVVDGLAAPPGHSGHCAWPGVDMTTAVQSCTKMAANRNLCQRVETNSNGLILETRDIDRSRELVETMLAEDGETPNILLKKASPCFRSRREPDAGPEKAAGDTGPLRR